MRAGGWILPGVVAALCLAPARAADSDSAKTPSWLPGWMALPWKGEKSKSPEPKATKTPARKAPMAEPPAVRRAREEANWLRRLEICNKLKEIAAQTNDLDLLRRAEQLDQRAWQLYLKHTANLPLGTVGMADHPPGQVHRTRPGSLRGE